MNLNRVSIHVLFVIVFSILFAKIDPPLADGAPIMGLVFMNTLLLLSGIIYGMFMMRNTYKRDTQKALEDLKKP